MFGSFVFFYSEKQSEHKKHNYKERIRVFSEHQNGDPYVSQKQKPTDSYFSNLK